MSEYDPPREVVPIFNPYDWVGFGDNPLTVSEGDSRYLKLVGGTEKGSVTFTKDITLNGQLNYTDGIHTASLGLNGSGDLAFNASGSVNMDGLVLNMTNGEIHNCPLVHSQQNNDIVIEGKGTANVILKSANTNRVVLDKSGNLAVDTNTLYVDATNNRVGVNNATPAVDLDVVGSGKVSSNLTVDTNSLYVDGTNHRVGVGTITPQAKLDISGGGMYSVGAESRFSNTTYSDPDSGTARALKISGNGLAVSGGGKMDTLSVTGNLVADPSSNTLYVDSTNHRLGIATNAPTTTLDVSGNINTTGTLTVSGSSSSNIGTTTSSSDNVPLWVTAPNVSAGQTTTVRLGKNNSQSYNLGLISHYYAGGGSSSNRMDFGFFNQGTKFSVRGDGNVGIGNTAPGYKLEVSGTIASTSGYQTRTGSSGAYGSNVYNINYDGTNAQLYIDTTNLGTLMLQSKNIIGDLVTADTVSGTITFTTPQQTNVSVVTTVLNATSGKMFVVNISSVTSTGFNYLKQYQQGGTTSTATTEDWCWIAISKP